MRVLIAGAGIGGLAAALYLHRAGIEVEVFEQAGGIRELGVGINVLPHSVAELADLGLLDALDAVAIRTGTLVYQNRFGQTVWTEPRGLGAGYDVPQFSIHRGRFQRVLYEAVAERIGADHVHVGHRLTDFCDGENAITARLAGRDGTVIAEREGDVLVGADGIHSAVRAHHYPDQGPPSWNGMMMWRGATVADPIDGGRLMVIAGGMDAKAVIYPIADDEDGNGRQLINWVVNVKLSDGSSPPPNKEDWSREGTWGDVEAHLNLFSLPDIDLAGLIKGADAFYEYPMCDRDPLPRWSFGRTTLLGDAAHPMYPVGSNGSAQAILDAKALAQHLAAASDTIAALTAYDEERRPKTAEIVYLNRKGGPERVIDVVTERAPQGFDKLDDVVSEEELRAIVGNYAGKSGFSRDALSRKTVSS